MQQVTGLILLSVTYGVIILQLCYRFPTLILENRFLATKSVNLHSLLWVSASEQVKDDSYWKPSNG